LQGGLFEFELITIRLFELEGKQSKANSSFKSGHSFQFYLRLQHGEHPLPV